MSKMLKEKRAEFVAKLNVLEATRQAEIDAKVAAYRKSLEESTSSDEILKVTNVIAALDEVIGYESASAQVEVQHSVSGENTVSQEQRHTSMEARPGMATVITPVR